MASPQRPADAQVPVLLSHQEPPEARTQLCSLTVREFSWCLHLGWREVSSSGASRALGHQDSDFGRYFGKKRI